MLLPCCTSLSSCAVSSQKTFFFRNPKRTCKFTCVHKVGLEDIAEVIHNKVLIAAGVSAGIGQISKPFTGSLLYGRNFDLKAAFQAGGFPSAHSSCVLAAATCLALERGFSDSIFGSTLVYAGLVMFDAQGVRREVGIHAKTLNKLLHKTRDSSRVTKDRDIAMSSSLSDDKEEGSERNSDNSAMLKESIGHTEVEVVAGALLGFIVSLVVSTIM